MVVNLILFILQHNGMHKVQFSEKSYWTRNVCFDLP